MNKPTFIINEITPGVWSVGFMIQGKIVLTSNAYPNKHLGEMAAFAIQRNLTKLKNGGPVITRYQPQIMTKVRYSFILRNLNQVKIGYGTQYKSKEAMENEIETIIQAAKIAIVVNLESWKGRNN